MEINFVDNRFVVSMIVDHRGPTTALVNTHLHDLHPVLILSGYDVFPLARLIALQLLLRIIICHENNYVPI